MKIVTILGARPQFIKAAPVSRALKEAGIREYLVHTGQHYDYGMSQVFFDELNLPEPNVNLGVGSGSHGKQTGQMLMGIEEVLSKEKPDLVLVYGDTNSTLAGSLAAVKLHFPLAHVEAGLRSFNRVMPEEHNRVLTDHCADLLFCPTQTAVKNLATEGIKHGVHWVGDTMYDAVLEFSEVAEKDSTILKDLGLEPLSYCLATIHRPYNTDVPANLSEILSAFVESGEKIIFPVHPRTRDRLDALDISGLERSKVQIIEPVSYLDILMLEKHSRLILTDSGGIQKEAYFFAIPCITLRSETEWVETVKAGWNRIVSPQKKLIIDLILSRSYPETKPPPLFGSGSAACHIVNLINSSFLCE